jgi:broad specificity phosphatase PhoE
LTTLHLIRHGETAWNAERRFQGQSDIPLSERGREQAEELADMLAGRRIGAVYSSDLSRALETARPLAERLGLEVVVDPRLRERHFGWAEGRTDDEVDSRYPSAWWANPDSRMPGGESRRDVWTRVAEFLDELLGDPPADEIALVTHGGAIRVAAGYLAQEDLETLERRSYANISVTTVQVER